MLVSNDVSSGHSAHDFMWLNVTPNIPAAILSFITFQPNRKLLLVRYVGSGVSVFTYDGCCNFLKNLCVSSDVPVDIANVSLSISLQDCVTPI